MKKIIFTFLSLILLCSLFVTNMAVVSADDAQSDYSLKYVITDEHGQSNLLANEGDEITVYFKIQRTDSSENYAINGFQNDIYYDTSLFQFVEGSIVCYDEGATVQKVPNITYGEIVQCSVFATGKIYEANFVFCSFKLKVIAASGNGKVSSDNELAFDSNLNAVVVEKQDLTVVVGVCSHAGMSSVEAKEPTCTEKGWSAYCYCSECGFFFDESGETQIPSVPFVEESHTGEPVVKDGFAPLPWKNGYTGDTYCSECQQLIEHGESISQWDFLYWPWWVYLIPCLIPLLALFFVG